MHRIALATEPLTKERKVGPPLEAHGEGLNEITEATTLAAGQLAEMLDAQILIVASGSGETASVVSKHRSYVPVVGVSDSEAALRKMCLYWGGRRAGRRRGRSFWSTSSSELGRPATSRPAIEWCSSMGPGSGRAGITWWSCTRSSERLQTGPGFALGRHWESLVGGIGT